MRISLFFTNAAYKIEAEDILRPFAWNVKTVSDRFATIMYADINDDSYGKLKDSVHEWNGFIQEFEDSQKEPSIRDDFAPRKEPVFSLAIPHVIA